jgi:type II secretory pathway pseudopilin PulG
MKTQPGGFIMVEVIVSIVLLGILGVFTSMFLYTGIKGYMISKQTADGAMRAQIALDRMNLELRKVTSVTVKTNDSITYTADGLPGTRRIFYDNSDADNHTISIEVDDGTPEDHALLDNIKPNSFLITLLEGDLNNDSVNEISGIEIDFTLTDIGRPFNLRVYPRNWLAPPP